MAFAGFGANHERSAWDDEGVRAATLDLLTLGHWHAQLRFLWLLITPGQPRPRRPGMIPAKKLREELTALLTTNSTWSLTLCTARETRPDSELFEFEARLDWGPPVVHCHGVRAHAEAGTDAWVSDVLTYFDRTRSVAGVVTSLPTRAEVITECSTGSISRDGVPCHPWPEEAKRMKFHLHDMGTRYMRFPRWGTLVGHAHLAALGGRAAIEAAVEPAKVVELSGGLYLQLTESIATAGSPEALAKQDAFRALATPLLPPEGRP
ncbi:MAG: hypothetical protein KBG48_14485 [Kofleriaceae bacterium]|jgi:hypothetical protein|nr:hypothetical protein [Kofleriaceae bacterium]MBP9168599.1 hypothetical protein [Kofleriaceae bacterium]MBP9857527.1 hypothetical protein [Kofleriaceae bacterium]